ncbi:Maf-like protein [Shewanella marinintestina]|uniref:Maf family protein n=1 Tax=Shewanella marinintestina TaxID=190305 RepID=UPI00200BF572|nr:nucleoside triphosphate pyrophosphatase [Shewanella marinintestina]MCL1144788.1 Maf-like protein [Shewanella marinintestina]
MTAAIVLASTSPYRQQVLEKLKLPFTTYSPEVDETPLENESPYELVLRLAKLKAAAGAAQHPDSIIIGSDQVAVINGSIIGKPHTREKAIEQLCMASGQAITFYTGLALHNSSSGQIEAIVEPFTVHFRTLTHQQICRYIDIEQPLYCAGSFKSEGLGIALFEKLEGKDPNTLIGLPLISLIDLLHLQGSNVL